MACATAGATLSEQTTSMLRVAVQTLARTGCSVHGPNAQSEGFRLALYLGARQTVVHFGATPPTTCVLMLHVREVI